LLKEVSFSDSKEHKQSKSTYVLQNITATEVIEKHKTEIKDYNISIPTKQLSLPFLFWIPKMHKTSSKQRCIAASYSCSTKAVSSILTKVLELIYQSHKFYCDRIHAYTGYNCMWIIQNSLEIHEVLHTCRSKARNLQTYDFSTLYTSIPHYKLKDKVSSLVIKSFDSQNWKVICVKHDKATWCQVEKKKRHLFVLRCCCLSFALAY